MDGNVSTFFDTANSGADTTSLAEDGHSDALNDIEPLKTRV